MQCNKRSALLLYYSINSSARARSVGVTSRPSAFAVLRLITKLVLALNRQIRRLLTLENAVDVDAALAV
jgi:hypothetical protein